MRTHMLAVQLQCVFMPKKYTFLQRERERGESESTAETETESESESKSESGRVKERAGQNQTEQ